MMLPAFRRISYRTTARYFHRSTFSYNDKSTLYKNESRKSGEVNVDVPVPPDVHDFALDTRPVGAFACFSQPNCYNNPEFKLSSAQLAQYAKDGYVSNVPVSWA
jgi:hypothetical protein